MALIQANIFSQKLMRTVPIHVILPADKLLMPGMKAREDKPYKTLYLLHGIFGNYTDWITGTRIQRWAEEKDLVVVMPSGDNASYVDQPAAHNFYGEFIGEELVNLTRKMFNLSHKREDTFIAGLSMGGYGALRNGFKYHETFGIIGAFSAGFMVEMAQASTYDTPEFIRNRAFFESILGKDIEGALESDLNPRYSVKKIIKEKAEMPLVYMACGVDDFLFDLNEAFHDFLVEHKVPVTYEKGDGAHEWDFWDRYIKRFIDWLPLDEEQNGVNSGNVVI